MGQLKALTVGAVLIGGAFVAFDIMKPQTQEPAPVTEAKPAKKTALPAAPKVATGSDATEGDFIAPVAPAKTVVAVPPVDGGSKPAKKVAGEVERFAKETELVLTGLDAGREVAITRDKDLFVRAINGQAWNSYRALLAKSIDAGLAKLGKGAGSNRFDAVWKEPSLYQIGRASCRERV